jgi:hypothetical protein
MFEENLDVFLGDFGVEVSAGPITGRGVLDMPTEVLADGMVLSTDYTLTCKTSEFGNLLYDSTVLVEGVVYVVRSVRKIDDGRLCEVALTKVATDEGLISEGIVEGGDPGSLFSGSNTYDGGTP